MDESGMTLLRDWNEHPVDGWFWSEKFDGCRAFWDGARFWTRGGNRIAAPESIIAEMPDGIPVDGEMFAGRGKFEEARIAVQYGRFSRKIKFVAFDAPAARGTWDQRMAACKNFLGGRFARAAQWGVVKDILHANRIFSRILYAGGEGIVLRNPLVDFYEKGRTENALRIKY
jgi:DNA ligase-1